MASGDRATPVPARSPWHLESILPNPYHTGGPPPPLDVARQRARPTGPDLDYGRWSLESGAARLHAAPKAAPIRIGLDRVTLVLLRRSS